MQFYVLYFLPVITVFPQPCEFTASVHVEQMVMMIDNNDI